ncbi:MAG TPA: ATP-binding protein [Acidimicrobiales bacterium]|nr:ATP-binding protein [Acidimicrobiales bacterium]
MEECLDLESRPDLVRAARRFVRQVLANWELPEFVDDAELVASELVSNAVLHARTALRLTVSSEGLGAVRIEVYDENPRMPTTTATPLHATSGRGLLSVAALASAWGTEDRGDGKVVWARLGRPPAAGDRDCVDLTGAATIDEALEEIDGRASADGRLGAPDG